MERRHSAAFPESAAAAANSASVDEASVDENATAGWHLVMLKMAAPASMNAIPADMVDCRCWRSSDPQSESTCP